MTAEEIKTRFGGKDNYGKLKSIYIDRILGMDDKALQKECEHTIWLSAFASNNHRSDYHWHVDVCYAVCSMNDKTDIYKQAYKEVERGVKGE